jgi:hypothetical protein
MAVINETLLSQPKTNTSCIKVKLARMEEMITLIIVVITTTGNTAKKLDGLSLLVIITL